jgi:predicted aspartyl protease
MARLLMRISVVSVVAIVLVAGSVVLITSRGAFNGTADLVQDEAGRFTTSVMVNGHGPFAFVVDTGAAMSCIQTSLAKELSLPVMPLVRVNVQGTSGTQKASFYLARAYSSAVFDRKVEPLVQLLSPPSVKYGVVGMNAFASKRIEFDFASRHLTLRASGPAPEDFATQTAQLQGTDVIVDVRVDGVAARALIDTGARRTVGNLALQRALGLKTEDLASTDPIEGATTDRIPAVKSEIGLLTLGPAQFAKPTVEFADSPVFRRRGLDTTPAVILGIDLLAKLKILAVDYPRAEVQLQP